MSEKLDSLKRDIEALTVSARNELSALEMVTLAALLRSAAGRLDAKATAAFREKHSTQDKPKTPAPADPIARVASPEIRIEPAQPMRWELYVDGAVTPDGSLAGVGVVSLSFLGDGASHSGIKVYSHSLSPRTNQAAEISAAIIGLSKIPEKSSVTVISDSQYVVSTMMKGWARRANVSLWPLLDDAVARMDNVSFKHVRGHNGDVYNEKADKLAVAAKTGARVDYDLPAS